MRQSDPFIARVASFDNDDKKKKDQNNSKGNDKAKTFAAVLTTVTVEVVSIALLCLACGAGTVLRVNRRYLYPQVANLGWNDGRIAAETTYYARLCDADDVSAADADALRLPANATAGAAYAHYLTHGFTVFGSLVDAGTAAAVRQIVLKQNRDMDPALQEFLWQPQHRYVTELGTAKDGNNANDGKNIQPIRDLLQQVATHPLFVASLEKIMGPNPALIEFNGITSEYGAVHQTWHSDGSTDSTPMNYARSFGPSHVLLMQLQDTTVGMGATHVCPGTHFCTDLQDKVCSGDVDTGALAVPSAAGDGLLMNTNGWHRGAAFTDRDLRDVHRVMLAITFYPQPLRRDESRRPPGGVSFSLPWSMWGQTLADLAQNGGLPEPWSYGRALGLVQGPPTWKLAGNRRGREGRTAVRPRGNDNWGVDYTTLQLLRYATPPENNIGIYAPWGAYDFVEDGGFSPWIPLSLHGDLPDEDTHWRTTWHNFYTSTGHKCFEAVGKVYVVVTLLYLLLSVSSRKRPERVWVRVIVFHAIILGAVWRYNRSIDESPWARDIASGDRFHVNFPTKEEEGTSATKKNLVLNEYTVYTGPTVYPFKTDVMIETRLGSRHLFMYNDFVDAHPGNRQWRRVLTQQAPHFASYSQGILPPAFADAVVQQVIQSMKQPQTQEYSARFLYQDIYTGDWMLLDEADTEKYARESLQIFNPNVFVRPLLTEIQFLQSDCLYGHLRETALCRIHGQSNLNHLKQSILRASLHKESQPVAAKGGVVKNCQFITEPPSSVVSTAVKALKRDAVTKIGWKDRRNKLETGDTIENYPEDIFSLMEGDVVECHDEVDGHWYPARVDRVTSQGTFDVAYLDDPEEGFLSSIDYYDIRPLIPYNVVVSNNEHQTKKGNIECYFENDKAEPDGYATCEALEWNPSANTCTVVIKSSGRTVENFNPFHLRRRS